MFDLPDNLIISITFVLILLCHNKMSFTTKWVTSQLNAQVLFFFFK